VPAHTLRRTFATRLRLNGVDIRQIQEYPGHAHVETTMIYTHVVEDLRTAPLSPRDWLLEEHRARGSSRRATEGDAGQGK